MVFEEDLFAMLEAKSAIIVFFFEINQCIVMLL